MEDYRAIVDLAFSIRGTYIPADHGYPLYAAISRLLPSIHGDHTVGIHPIRGQIIGQRRVALTQASQLVLRLPAASIAAALRLAGQHLDVAGARVLVGVPTVHALTVASTLGSRLVVIRGFLDSGDFLEAGRRQLVERGIVGALSLVDHQRDRPMEAMVGSRDRVVRRTLQVKDCEVVGFAVEVSELAPPDSLKLQVTGLGGRRRFGCGLFTPIPYPDRRR